MVAGWVQQWQRKRLSVWVQRECGVESAETMCEQIVPLVKLNGEQSLLYKYFKYVYLRFNHQKYWFESLYVYVCISKYDISIEYRNCFCIESCRKELIVPLINSIIELKICILDRSMVENRFHNYK